MSTFVRERSPVEAVASSLTELFSPNIIGERMSGMLANYDYVSKDTLAYFSYRPTQAKRDADWALDFVKTHAKTVEQQQAVIKALEFKCDVLWTQLDALWTAYVENYLLAGRLGAGHGRGAAQQGGMSDAVAISAESKPHLPRGMHLKHDATRDEWLLDGARARLEAQWRCRRNLEALRRRGHIRRDRRSARRRVCGGPRA